MFLYLLFLPNVFQPMDSCCWLFGSTESLTVLVILHTPVWHFAVIEGVVGRVFSSADFICVSDEIRECLVHSHWDYFEVTWCVQASFLCWSLLTLGQMMQRKLWCKEAKDTWLNKSSVCLDWEGSFFSGQHCLTKSQMICCNGSMESISQYRCYDTSSVWFKLTVGSFWILPSSALFEAAPKLPRATAWTSKSVRVTSIVCYLHRDHSD